MSDIGNMIEDPGRGRPQGDDQLRRANIRLTAELEQAQAACAVMAERLPRLVQDAWRHGFSSTDSGDMATCDAVAAAHVEADGAAALAAKAGQETPCTSPQNPPAPK